MAVEVACDDCWVSDHTFRRAGPVQFRGLVDIGDLCVANADRCSLNAVLHCAASKINDPVWALGVSHDAVLGVISAVDDAIAISIYRL